MMIIVLTITTTTTAAIIAVIIIIYRCEDHDPLRYMTMMPSLRCIRGDGKGADTSQSHHH
jgi:hypothetical protein